MANSSWGFQLPYGPTWGLSYPTRTHSYSLPESDSSGVSGSASVLSKVSQAGGGLSAGGAAGAAGGAAIGMMVGKAIGDTYSVWSKGKTQRYVLKQQARIADSNAGLSQLGVEQAFRAGEAEAGAITLQAAQVKASREPLWRRTVSRLMVREQPRSCIQIRISRKKLIRTQRLVTRLRPPGAIGGRKSALRLKRR